MSPYIVTTTTVQRIRGDSRSLQTRSRHAVATLDDARSAVAETGEAFVITEHGGTIGPLPDGTVIEVEPASWGDLAQAVNWLGRGYVTEAEWPEVIAAYNAAAPSTNGTTEEEGR